MTFLHVSLLIGGLAALVPLVLHMLGRRQPKAITFPAIRFVRETAIQAQRGWSIKRWLLLALRVLMMALLALALASPRVQSNMLATYLLIGLLGVLALLATAIALTSYGSRRPILVTLVSSTIALGLWLFSGGWLATTLSSGQVAPIPSATGPIAVAVVIDTSPSMGYQFHNQSRLDAAKEMATWLMDRLPIGSQIAIVNNDAGLRLNQDRVSANRQLDRTTVEGRATNLVQRVSSSIEVLRKSELERREVYVLTDLSAAAWRDAEVSDVAAKLLRAGKTDSGNEAIVGPNVLVQLIDVSVPVKELRNWSLNQLKISQQTATPGSQVTLSAELQSLAGSGKEQMTVELAVEPVDRSTTFRDAKLSASTTARVVDRQLIEVPDGGSVPFRLTLKELAEGTNHAEIRISRPDPLEVDNIYYVSIDARSQGQTLVVADNKRDGTLVGLGIDPDAEQVSEVPEPKAASETKTREPLFKWETESQLGSTDLSRYSSMVLFNPTNLSADAVDRVAAWVDQGGGLMIVLASGFETADAMMNSPLSKLLPGTAKRITRRALSDRSLFLAPTTNNHPIWSIFEGAVEEVPWINSAVFKHWDIEELSPESTVLMRFTQNEQPGLIETIRKQGRILTLTVPYPEPSSHPDDDPWSELYKDWPGFSLFQGSVRYLAAWNKQQLNYQIDEPAVLDNNIAQFPQSYLLISPNGEEVRVESSNESLLVPFTRQPGQYRLRGLRPQGPVVRGFSVNVHRDEISLERVSVETLDKALGKEAYRIAKEKEEVQSSLGEGRYGSDLAPFLMLAVVGMILAEQTMASRFYTQSKKSSR